MEKMPKIVLTSQLIETYGKINLSGMCSHPINANRLRCQTNTEWDSPEKIRFLMVSKITSGNCL